jgi:hypothetical protein
MKNLLKFFILIAFLLNFSIAEALPKNLTGIYSNMSYNRQGGDVNGIEIFITYSKKGYFVHFQDAEGSPNIPIIVPAILKENTLTFVLPERNGYMGEFRGVFKKNQIVGHFDAGQINYLGGVNFNLKRGLSYWQLK